MQRYIEADLVAGTVTLVARRGHVVHFEAHGYRDVDARSPKSTDTIFSLASMTKPVTSVAMMMLWEKGYFILDDPVAKYLPEFADVQVSTTGDASGGTGSLEPPRSPMTIGQLLTHTAGLANRYIDNLTFYNKHMLFLGSPSGNTLENWVKRLAELPLNYHPGTDCQYSHGTDVVARIVEVISGISFDAFLQKGIFGPLHMTNTSYYLETTEADRLASQYRFHDAGHATQAPINQLLGSLVNPIRATLNRGYAEGGNSVLPGRPW